MMTDEERERWRANYQNAWAGLRLIRQTIETLSPPGTLTGEVAVLSLYGSEPIHEAQAISDALQRLLSPAAQVAPPLESPKT